MIHCYGYGKFSHASCFVFLNCALDPPSDGQGRCSACLVGEECPEKGKPTNFHTCKRGEYNCPLGHICSRLGDFCAPDSTNLRQHCCLGMKCDGEKCVTDPCKKSGDCSGDDECCDNYGCADGKVVHAIGQNCISDLDCLRDTKCHSIQKNCC